MTPSRTTIAALDNLERVLTSSIEDLQALLVRIGLLRERLETGRPLSELLEHAERPLIIESLTGLLDRLGDVSSALRRAEARQLFAEGYTRTRIAATFGVSRQRATTLLRTNGSAADTTARKRARRGGSSAG